ncbi:hypothetical protein I4F81_011411 [Pyropia yezoensis]|uniref:Uncharacterized protein n=1 Tax=Pyropia yezoensis TaxID=2788 RepID=A0ACC3CG62_PYRYE|nr:hypothetical protein I4F81_011411 [Neopyropia yezoensis]
MFEHALATSPAKPPVVVDCTSELRSVFEALQQVATPVPVQQSAYEELVLVATSIDVIKKPADSRYGAVGMVAGAGSGKTYLLEQIASKARGSSVFQADETAMVKLCEGIRPYVVNFGLYWKLRAAEAYLLVDKNVMFSFDDLVNLRLLFMHFADVSALYVESHFTRFVAAVNLAVRSNDLSAQDLESETVALLQSNCNEVDDVLPVVLVDEVGRTDDVKEKACRTLLGLIADNQDLYTVNDQLHSPSTLLLSAACNIVQQAGGNVITTFMSSYLSARCATLSGRRIFPVGGLFGRNALAYQAVFVDVLVRVAGKNGFYLAVDGAMSGSHGTLQAIVAARAKLERSDSYGVKVAALEDLRAAMIPIANGMCYSAGGHARTVVQLHNELFKAGMKRHSTSLLTLIERVSSNLLLSEAEDCWVAASNDDRDNLLAALTLGEEVSRRDVCFPERLHPTTGDVLSKNISYDDARLMGLVVGQGERFQPSIPPVALFLLMESAKGSLFYPVMHAELGLGKEEPGTFDTAREVPWMRWEDFFMRYQAVVSMARSKRKERYNAVSLAEVLAVNGAIYLGDGPLLRDNLVDASTPRTQVLQRDLLAILTARGGGVAKERAKTIYQLPYGTPGADAVVFFRTVGAKPDWVMVLMQFRHSRDDASTKVRPADVIADWEKFPGEHVMGRKYFTMWRNRLVYLNASKREHEGFPGALQSKNEDVVNVCSQHSVVLSMANLEAALGPTFYNYINTMDWIHCASLQPF